MKQSKPTIREFMTGQPYFVLSSAPLSEASEIMSQFEIRHLPIMESNKVFGVISDRDLNLVMGILGVDPEKVMVRNLCSQDLFQVVPDTPLTEVAEEMANHHYGCALVVEQDNLLGIFTTVDACRAISQIVREQSAYSEIH